MKNMTFDDVERIEKKLVTHQARAKEIKRLRRVQGIYKMLAFGVNAIRAID